MPTFPRPPFLAHRNRRTITYSDRKRGSPRVRSEGVRGAEGGVVEVAGEGGEDGVALVQVAQVLTGVVVGDWWRW